MAFSASGLFCQTFVDALDGTETIDFDASNMFKVALYSNTVVVTATTHFEDTAVKSSYNGAAGYFLSGGDASGSAAGYQVFQAGKWAQHGEVLGTNGGGYNADLTKLNDTTGVIKFDSNDNASVTGCSMQGIRGCYIYADAPTTPVVDPGLCAITFGADYAVTNGTFTIQWNASGIFTLDLA